MTTEAEPNLAIDSSDRIDRTRLTWPKRITIIITLLGAYAPFFFFFLIPSELLFFGLLAIGAVFAVPLAVFCLQALFRLRWKLVSIFAVVWVLLSLPFIGPSEPLRSMILAGFYIRTLLVDDYRSGCHATEFIENGVTQRIGACEGFDRGEFFEDIVYDTTGEFMRPVSQRTPEWMRAMSGATFKEAVSKEGIAYHLFGNYYHVNINAFDLKG